MLLKLCRAVRGLSLGIWLGGGIMTFIAAHYVFNGGFIGKSEAGDVMGAILHAGGFLKLGLAAAALVAHFGTKEEYPVAPKSRKLGFVALLIAIVLTLMVVFWLEPAMVALRPQFRNDPNPENPAHKQFNGMHGASMGGALLELICIAVALICAVI